MKAYNAIVCEFPVSEEDRPFNVNDGPTDQLPEAFLPKVSRGKPLADRPTPDDWPVED